MAGLLLLQELSRDTGCEDKVARGGRRGGSGRALLHRPTSTHGESTFGKGSRIGHVSERGNVDHFDQSSNDRRQFDGVKIEKFGHCKI